jgi:hypothetical protein
MVFAPTFPAFATGRLIPIRWRHSAWFPRILNRGAGGEHNRNAGRRVACARDIVLRSAVGHLPRRWLFSAAQLAPVRPETRKTRQRLLRRGRMPLHFRPLAVFSSTDLRRSFVSTLNQHPGL